MASVQKYLNPLILNKKPYLKIKKSFYNPFTFWPTSSLWPMLLFLGTGPLRSAFRLKSAHSRPPLSPSFGRDGATAAIDLHHRLPSPCAMETGVEPLRPSFNTPS
jgi:hypothetical protein